MRRIVPAALALWLALTGAARAALPPWASAVTAPGPLPGSLWVLTDAERRTVASYDVALFALEALREGEPDTASRLLGALSTRQTPDGGLPFSFRLAAPPETPALVRSGAVAWVVYASARLLDTGLPAGQKEAIAALAHRGAGYLLARQIRAPGDPREGLVTGGSGRYVYERSGAGVTERFEPGEAAWAAAEHNVDAAFALAALGAVTGQARYAEAARRVSAALEARLWSPEAGQFLAGVGPQGPDATPALDAASWGALYWAARGRAAEAAAACRTARTRYASLDPATGARGHKPYAGGPVYESGALQAVYGPTLPAPRWSGVAGVWPEGTAGVAMAACRVGDAAGALGLLADLAPLRRADGRYAGFSREVPYLFERAPALAGTLWARWAAAEAAGQAPFVWRERLE